MLERLVLNVEFHGVNLVDEEYNTLVSILEEIGKDENSLFTITDLEVYKRWKNVCKVYEISFNNPTSMDALLTHMRTSFKKMYTASKLASKEIPIEMNYVELKDETPEYYLKPRAFKVSDIPCHFKTRDQVILYPYSKEKPDNTKSDILYLPTEEHFSKVKKIMKRLHIPEPERLIYNKTMRRLIQYAYPYCKWAFHPTVSDNQPLYDIVDNSLGHDRDKKGTSILSIQHELLTLRVVRDLKEIIPVYFDTTDEHVTTLWLHLFKDDVKVDVSRLEHLIQFNPGHDWMTVQTIQ